MPARRKKTPRPAAEGVLKGYNPEEYYCEMIGRRDLGHTKRICQRLERLDLAALRRRSRDAGRKLFNLGITFTVYTDRNAIDRILPFDVIPRVLSVKDWQQIESSVRQRIAAINLFLHDIYHDQKILKDGVVPADLVLGNANYRPECLTSAPMGQISVIA